MENRYNYCPKCGTKIVNHSNKFCTNCGNQLLYDNKEFQKSKTVNIETKELLDNMKKSFDNLGSELDQGFKIIQEKTSSLKRETNVKKKKINEKKDYVTELKEKLSKIGTIEEKKHFIMYYQLPDDDKDQYNLAQYIYDMYDEILTTNKQKYLLNALCRKQEQLSDSLLSNEEPSSIQNDTFAILNKANKLRREIEKKSKEKNKNLENKMNNNSNMENKYIKENIPKVKSKTKEKKEGDLTIFLYWIFITVLFVGGYFVITIILANNGHKILSSFMLLCGFLLFIWWIVSYDKFKNMW